MILTLQNIFYASRFFIRPSLTKLKVKIKIKNFRIEEDFIILELNNFATIVIYMVSKKFRNSYSAQIERVAMNRKLITP